MCFVETGSSPCAARSSHSPGCAAGSRKGRATLLLKSKNPAPFPARGFVLPGTSAGKSRVNRVSGIRLLLLFRRRGDGGGLLFLRLVVVIIVVRAGLVEGVEVVGAVVGTGLLFLFLLFLLFLPLHAFVI